MVLYQRLTITEVRIIRLPLMMPAARSLAMMSSSMVKMVVAVPMVDRLLAPSWLLIRPLWLSSEPPAPVKLALLSHCFQKLVS